MGGGQNRLWLRTLGKSIPSFASATLKITSPETATSVPNWDQSNSVCFYICCYVLDPMPVKKRTKTLSSPDKDTHKCLHKQKVFLKGHTKTVNSNGVGHGAQTLRWEGGLSYPLFYRFHLTHVC